MGGTIFRFYGGDTAVMRGDIELMGDPPVPPTRENPGQILHHTKGVRNTKSRHLGNTWLTTKNLIPQPLAKKLLRSPKQIRHFHLQQNS